jgi:hypothetical protein
VRGGRPPSYYSFICPNCQAFYDLVKVEAGPETTIEELKCLSCGGPLPARDGNLVLKYFLLRKAGRVQKSRRARMVSKIRRSDRRIDPNGRHRLSLSLSLSLRRRPKALDTQEIFRALTTRSTAGFRCRQGGRKAQTCAVGHSAYAQARLPSGAFLEMEGAMSWHQSDILRVTAIGGATAAVIVALAGR